ncbi:hypothetical protein [Ligilactobacillus ruminis]|uniref:hypothetical protein n=1 Tax=Ligilactobacillus ruminis TaxID=1623 RepID=UPI003F9C499A
MKQEVKKLLILNLPYLLFVYLFDKIGAAIRLTPAQTQAKNSCSLVQAFPLPFPVSRRACTPPICLSALRGRSLSGLPFTSTTTD